MVGIVWLERWRGGGDGWECLNDGGDSTACTARARLGRRRASGAAARIRGARCRASPRNSILSLERLLPVSSLRRRRGGGAVCSPRTATRDACSSSAISMPTAPPGRALAGAGAARLHFAHVDFLVPNRFRFGYGLTPEIVALAAARAPSLIVTVDNGVSSIDGRRGGTRSRHSGARHRSPSAGRRCCRGRRSS